MYKEMEWYVQNFSQTIAIISVSLIIPFTVLVSLGQVGTSGCCYRKTNVNPTTAPSPSFPCQYIGRTLEEIVFKQGSGRDPPACETV